MRKKFIKRIISLTLAAAIHPVETQLKRLYKLSDFIQHEIKNLESLNNHKATLSIAEEVDHLKNELIAQAKTIQSRLSNLQNMMFDNIALQVQNALLQLRLSKNLRKEEWTKNLPYLNIHDINVWNEHPHSNLHPNPHAKKTRPNKATQEEFFAENEKIIKDEMAYKEKEIRQYSYFIHDVCSRLIAIQQATILILNRKKHVLSQLLKEKRKDKEIEAVLNLSLSKESIVQLFENQENVVQFQLYKLLLMRLKLQNINVEIAFSSTYLENLKQAFESTEEKMGLASTKESQPLQAEHRIKKIKAVATYLGLKIIKSFELARLKTNKRNCHFFEVELHRFEHELYRFEDELIQQVVQGIQSRQATVSEVMPLKTSTTKQKTLSEKQTKNVEHHKKLLIHEIEDAKARLDDSIGPFETNAFFSNSTQKLNTSYLKSLQAILNLADLGELDLAENTVLMLLKSHEVLQKTAEFQKRYQSSTLTTFFDHETFQLDPTQETGGIMATTDTKNL